MSAVKRLSCDTEPSNRDIVRHLQVQEDVFLTIHFKKRRFINRPVRGPFKTAFSVVFEYRYSFHRFGCFFFQQRL